MAADPLFYREPSVLFLDGRALELIPRYGAPAENAHNAVQRFILSAATTSFAATRDARVLVAALAATVANVLASELRLALFPPAPARDDAGLLRLMKAASLAAAAAAVATPTSMMEGVVDRGRVIETDVGEEGGFQWGDRVPGPVSSSAFDESYEVGDSGRGLVNPRRAAAVERH